MYKIIHHPQGRLNTFDLYQDLKLKTGQFQVIYEVVRLFRSDPTLLNLKYSRRSPVHTGAMRKTKKFLKRIVTTEKLQLTA